MNIHGAAWQATRLAVLVHDDWTCRMLRDDDGVPLREQTDRTAGTEHGIPLTRHQPNAPTHGTADHIVPRAAGGTDDLSNLQAACRRCNSQRSAVIVNAERVRPLNTSRAWW